MRYGFIVVGIVGLLAITTTFLLKQASQRLAQKSRDMERWEDDGGNLPSKVPNVEFQSS